MFDIEFNDCDEGELGANPTDKCLDADALRALKRNRRITQQLTKPSTTLLLGKKGNLRHETRVRLRYILNRLVRRRNWNDAGGVLSILLKGTFKERSLHENRIKYSLTMELLGHIKGHHAYSRDTETIYNLWMQKIAPPKNRPWKDRFVLFDSIFTFLMQKNYDGARACALCLSQDREADSDPISNLIMGLCYYELWYTTLPEDRQLTDIHDADMLDETEESATELHDVVENSEGYPAGSIEDTNSSFKYKSETSIMNDKVILLDNLNKKDSVPPATAVQLKGLYIKSDQTSGSEGGPLMNRNTKTQNSPAFSSHGIPDSLLFPVQWDPSNENIADVIQSLHINSDYKDAVEYLRKALNSKPGAEEALLPLVQILLLNDRVKEALDELENFCYASKSIFASRLKAHYFECLGCNSYELLISYYEDILKEDPTCKHSLTRLVRAYQMGDYDAQRLLEMMALHLDASFADDAIWKIFASCLLKVNQCEEDRSSTCLNGDIAAGKRKNQKIPVMFMKGVLGMNWKLHCKCWLHRHFSKKSLASEMAGGHMSLMAYKAACAAQIYGPEFHYVVKVGAILKEGEDPLFTDLNMYVQCSSGLYTEFSGELKLTSSWKEVFNCIGKLEGNVVGKEANTGRRGREEEKKSDGEKTVRKRGRSKSEDVKERKRKREEAEIRRETIRGWGERAE